LSFDFFLEHLVGGLLVGVFGSGEIRQYLTLTQITPPSNAFTQAEVILCSVMNSHEHA